MPRMPGNRSAKCAAGVAVCKRGWGGAAALLGLCCRAKLCAAKQWQHPFIAASAGGHACCPTYLRQPSSNTGVGQRRWPRPRGTGNHASS